MNPPSYTCIICTPHFAAGTRAGIAGRARRHGARGRARECHAAAVRVQLSESPSRLWAVIRHNAQPTHSAAAGDSRESPLRVESVARSANRPNTAASSESRGAI